MPRRSRLARSRGLSRAPVARRKPLGAKRRRNPELVTFLANPARVRVASDVQAVLYRHAKNGAYYLHVFGNQGDGEIMKARGREYLRLDNLPARTGVVLERIGGALLVRHKTGAPLAREFPG